MRARGGRSASAAPNEAAAPRPPAASGVTTLTRSSAASCVTRWRRVVDIASNPRRIRLSHSSVTTALSSPATRTRTGRSGPTSATGVLQREALPDRDAGAAGRARRQLERRARAAAAGQPPGPQSLDDLAHGELAVDEDHVDREAHEEHVHRVGGTEQEPLPRLELAAAEEAAHPGRRGVGDDAAV